MASWNSAGMGTTWLLPFMNTRLGSASITGTAACVRFNKSDDIVEFTEADEQVALTAVGEVRGTTDCGSESSR